MSNGNPAPKCERFLGGLKSAAALRIEAALYEGEPVGQYLFRLRKSLEGVWDPDLPRVDEWGCPRPEQDECPAPTD